MAVYSEFKKKWSLINIESMKEPLARRYYDNFVDKKGEILKDDTASDEEFMDRYMLLIENKIYLTEEFEKYVTNLAKYLFSYSPSGPVLERMFRIEFIMLIIRCPVISSRVVIPEKKIEVVQEKEYHDFLGVNGVPKKIRLPSSYPEEERGKYVLELKEECEKVPRDIKKRVLLYHRWLKALSVKVPLKLQDYSSPYEFVSIHMNQFSHYYETLKAYKKTGDKRSIYAPSDGLGLASIICIILDIPYRSSESYGLGEVALNLGIITDDSSVSYDWDVEKEVAFFGNLSSFYEMSRVEVRGSYIIVDENRLWRDVKIDNIIKGSYGRVHSDLELEVVFPVEVLGIVAPLLSGKRAVPLDPKAEMYLLLEGIPVYTNGVIVTCTPSSVISDNDHVVFVLSRADIEEIIIYEMDNYYLHIKDKSAIVSPYARQGQLKFYRNKLFQYIDEYDMINFYNGFEFVQFQEYRNVRHLNSYWRDDVFILSKCDRPQSKKYIIEGGEKKRIMYLHSIFVRAKEEYLVHVFQERVDNMFFKREIRGLL